MTGIPKLTPQTRPAVEFGHRYLALPLIEAMRSAADRIESALAQGDAASATACAEELRRRANQQEQWTRQLLAGEG